MQAGVAQTEPMLGEKERNLAAILVRLEEGAAQAAELLVVPRDEAPVFVTDVDLDFARDKDFVFIT